MIDKMFPIFDKLFLLLTVNFILIECLNAEGCPADSNKPWSYDSNLPNGPEHWGEKYPLCNGLTQSPINIPSLITLKQNYEALNLIGYDKPITKFDVENTGYTVEFTPKDGSSRAMQVNGHIYSLQSFHFHWGKAFYEGAEHNINGISASIELHLVHQDTNGNLAVLGILSDVQPFKNQAYNPIVEYLPKVKYAKDKTKVDGSNNKKKQIKLPNLLPNNSPYYMYNGSLTTPPCSPNVTWVVYDHHSYLDLAQIFKFRQLISTTEQDAGSDEDCHLVNNFRPIQKRNGRKIFLFKNKN